MKRTPWAWILLTVLALGCGVAIGRMMTLGRAASDPPPPVPTAAGVKRHSAPPPLVGVARPKRTTIPVSLSLTANIASLRSAVIYSKVAGYLQTVTVRPGAAVKAGQVVATVDHAQLDAQVAQAQAAVLGAQSGVQTARVAVSTAQAQYLNAVAGRENAQAQLANAEAGVTKARATLVDADATQSRIAALVQQGASSQQSLDDAVAQVKTAQATLDAARAQVNVAQAQVRQAVAQAAAAHEQVAAANTQVHTSEVQVTNQQAVLQNARLSVADATITAPFDGVVVSRSLDPGAYVTPGTSTPILSIADLDQIDVTVNITEVQIASIRLGAPVQIHVDAYPGRIFRGSVSRIAGGADAATRTVQVEIDIANPGHLLRPGMYATATLSAGADENVLVVPLSALVTVGDRHFVWLVTDNVTHKRAVTVGRATGDVVEIAGGIGEGDQIVTRGTDLVREGQPVRSVSVAL
jgi:cobalt-zinc-cadmium efflux system membrane fusion protein